MVRMWLCFECFSVGRKVCEMVSGVMVLIVRVLVNLLKFMVSGDCCLGGGLIIFVLLIRIFIGLVIEVVVWLMVVLLVMLKIRGMSVLLRFCCSFVVLVLFCIEL